MLLTADVDGVEKSDVAAVPDIRAQSEATPTVEGESLCSNEDEGLYFGPLPGDCAGYYRCINNKPVNFKCRENTYWNDKGKNCDHKENVPCQADGTTSAASGRRSYITREKMKHRTCRN